MAEVRNNTVTTVSCDWDQFIRYVRSTPTLSSGSGFKYARMVVYRGHSNPEWKLSSTAERHLSILGADGTSHSLKQMNGEGWFKEECDRILSRFRYSTLGLPGFNTVSTELEAWLAGRHYGMLSPYLDWTLSPYVAAFFALEDIYMKSSLFRSHYATSHDGVVSIWSFTPWESIPEAELEIVSAESLHGSRARNQQSVFTRLHDRNHLDLEAYLKSKGLAHCLTRYDLNLRSAVAALKDLKRMNITFLSLFPDAQGAALQANFCDDWIELPDFMIPNAVVEN